MKLGTMHSIRAVVWVLMCCASMCAVSDFVAAQTPYPNKPIKLIAPTLPGGGVDLVARTVAERLALAFGQPVVVENQSAGAGIVASLATARAAPDGYTLMIGYVGTHGVKPALRTLPYDAVKDFTPIAMVGGTPNVLVVPVDFPADSLSGFVVHVKANPDKLAYGSGGFGTMPHLVMEQFKVATHIDLLHVAYRGVGQAFVDLFGGRIQAMLPGLVAAQPHIQAKRVKALAVTGTTRHPLLPDIPTFRESGYEELDAVQWYGVVGPANLPAPIVKRLNGEIAVMLQNAELREQLSREALEPMQMTPDQFSHFMRSDIARWTKLVKERNIEITE